MIAHLSGRIAEKTPTSVVLDVSGVGYICEIPVSSFKQLPAVGESVKLLTHFHVTADAHKLFGFYTPEERELFTHLISVSGVGPKMALTLLSGATVAEIADWIRKGKTELLTRVPGIGPKTASRLIVELKDKLEKMKITAVPGAVRVESTFEDEATMALVTLGYGRLEAKRAIEKALSTNGHPKNVEELIRQALRVAQ
ncbi:MAG: Holliday junction branch migration protein RuvA [candidate division Zixibacteria bacterium]|nr:Holliday junction branch migration protein RuvA [candidate division Zixibacteria bacterium]